MRTGVKNDVFCLQIAPLATCSSALLVGPNSHFLSATSTVVGGVQSGHRFLCTVAQRILALSVWSASILGVDIIQFGGFGGFENDAFCARNMRNTRCTRCKPSCTSGQMGGYSGSRASHLFVTIASQEGACWPGSRNVNGQVTRGFKSWCTNDERAYCWDSGLFVFVSMTLCTFFNRSPPRNP